jgi:Protein of unknown function (DUF2442)
MAQDPRKGIIGELAKSAERPGAQADSAAGVTMTDYHEMIDAVWVQGYSVRVTFDDLLTAVLDLEKYLGRGIFKELRRIGKFKQLRVDAELGTIVWPNGADIAPEVLYQDCLLVAQLGHSMASVKEPAGKYGKKK